VLGADAGAGASSAVRIHTPEGKTGRNGLSKAKRGSINQGPSGGAGRRVVCWRAGVY
jgi:hypothetical protein